MVDELIPDMNSKQPFSRGFQDAVNKFNHKAEEIIEAFDKTLPEEPPPIIYHYTDGVGLNGILKTGQLWLTDIFSLNDPSELSHGFSIAINILKDKVANSTPEIKKFAKQVADCYQQAGIQGSAQYFICSFSSQGNDLGQWRAYADNGRGYALGFDGKALAKGFVENGFSKDGIPNADAFRITYEDSRLAAIDCEIIESFFGISGLGLILRNGVSKEDMADLYAALTVHLLRAALFFKHEAYHNESEYRFLQTHVADEQIPNIKNRVRRYAFIKYKEFDWRSLAARALKEIIVGPAADHERARQFAEDCLLLSDAETVPITCSAIPYRAV